MPYDFLVEDLNQKLSQKAIGTDKGLAKIGDGLVNLAYSIAKSIFMTKKNANKRIIRTGKKVNKTILSSALKSAELKNFAKSRADAHMIADTAEAIVAYVWLNNYMSLEEMINILSDNLSGDLYKRIEETQAASKAFTVLLSKMKGFLPEK